MRIPKTLKIGGHQVKVVIGDAGEDYATWDEETNTITISSKLSQSQKESSLIHEIFHAMNVNFASDGHMHAFMDSIAEQWYQVIVDNKLLK